MKPYDQHSHVPTWMSALNGNLLTRAELDVLDFVWYCKKHGCRTSNDRIGMLTHHSHGTVQRAIHRIHNLNLVAIDNYGRRTRVIKPVPWPDQDTWLKHQDPRATVEADEARRDPHITLLDKTTPKESSSKVSSEPPTTGDNNLSRGETPRTPPRCSRGQDDSMYQLKARHHRDRMLEVGWTLEQANRLAKVKYPKAKFKDDQPNGSATG